ncbi:hypothetical protein PVA44_05125 [Entomospira nematocerorum]|uniref:Uncharacterized protein n=1 Tax=Entomospira nematocerorum TaxID=2719987 RepID=A0A968GG99_9SPIO|nr:hypothetical protein [Entomospira nematocera]NIZ46596.1 hypothetical protein [Entomospira nematocera]WDI33606.1 hypothetical protein PVA44_05125 [Entomospira nematocera]
MDKLELLYDHYRESCHLLESKKQSFNKVFRILWIILVVLILSVIDTDAVDYTIKDSAKSYAVTIYFPFSIIRTVLFAIMLYLILRYSEIITNMTRLEIYIEELERFLSVRSKYPILRERKHLQPIGYVKNINDNIYRLIFPFTLFFCFILTFVTHFFFQSKFSKLNNLEAHILIIATIILFHTIRDYLERTYKHTNDNENIKWCSKHGTQHFFRIFNTFFLFLVLLIMYYWFKIIIIQPDTLLNTGVVLDSCTPHAIPL